MCFSCRKWLGHFYFGNGRKLSAYEKYESLGQAIQPSDISFAAFLDNWIEHDCKLTCKDITVKGYEKKIRLYINPRLAYWPLVNAPCCYS